MCCCELFFDEMLLKFLTNSVKGYHPVKTMNFSHCFWRVSFLNVILTHQNVTSLSIVLEVKFEEFKVNFSRITIQNKEIAYMLVCNKFCPYTPLKYSFSTYNSFITSNPMISLLTVMSNVVLQLYPYTTWMVVVALDLCLITQLKFSVYGFVST